ncbi:helix-turn-helix transcriptional regulator [Rhizobium leguminosarum]|uniref:helix-turn-helix transcriptional regulator n=1 Tax=Rhizobium leguminosarum TaxID=384 RepID=UPI0013B6BA30|nr:LuxR family transcriptional regulator [Rhizobium leguminosarum]NEI67421.1 LuxR family transcriptional regulator [Rhizobium leguminosarum]
MQENQYSLSYLKASNAVKNATTVAVALDEFQQHYPVDFVTFHLARTIVDSVDAPFVRTTYPDSWVSRYLLNDYINVDPIIREGFSRQLPFDWREIDIPDSAHQFMVDAEMHGIGGNGVSIPIVDKSRRSLLSINSQMSDEEWTAIERQFLPEWTELGFLLHRKAVFELHGENDPVPALGTREVECLHWASRGKDSRDIAEILGLSEHTARGYLKSARYKLGCPTLSAAIAHAVHLNLITPHMSNPN